MICGWETLYGIPGWWGCKVTEGSATTSWYWPVLLIVAAVGIIAGYKAYKKWG